MEIPVKDHHMTRAEIAQLKEKLTADYKRNLEALELVEQMLNQPQKSQPPTGPRNKVQPTKVRPVAKLSGTTTTARIERAFEKQPTWTTPALATAIGTKNRHFVWEIVNRLVKEGKVRITRKPSGRQPAEYTSVMK
jgi:hypothetical protein